MSFKIPEFYESNIIQNKNELSSTRKAINLVVIFRLLVFVAGATIVTLLVRTYNWNFVFLAIPFIVPFLYLLKKHEALKFKKQYLENCILICKQELSGLEGDQSAFEDGTSYFDLSHPYSSDMDMFGKNSLFQYLNRTVTSGGRDLLANWLKIRHANEEILLRQKAVDELGDLPNWRIDFQAIGMMNGDDRNEKAEILEWVQESNHFYQQRFFHVISVAMPVMVILTLVLGLFFISPKIFLLFFLMQLAFIGIYLKKVNKLHAKVSRKYDLIKQFGNLLEKIELNTFSSAKLVQLKNEIGSSETSSVKKIKQLSDLIRLFDNRLNMLAGLLLNGLFMWDIHCVLKLEKWKTSNKHNIEKWLNVLSEFDALSSLANLHFNYPEFIFPQISSQQQEYKIVQCGHPLIPEKERVYNDLTINGLGQMLVITGSNMAGKSTFLRTIGVNLILAMSGAPVCASELSFYPVQLFSSMRIGDDLSNRESTFYAELKRLKQIIAEVEKQELFILLDEILKGTNSTDKLTGSLALLRQLVTSNSVGLIATHDLALGALEAEIPDKVHNYNFEVEIRNNEFYFDYKLKPGICKVLNATELMKKMGLRI